MHRMWNNGQLSSSLANPRRLLGSSFNGLIGVHRAFKIGPLLSEAQSFGSSVLHARPFRSKDDLLGAVMRACN